MIISLSAPFRAGRLVEGDFFGFGFGFGGLREAPEREEGGRGITYEPKQTLLFCCCPVSRVAIGKIGLEVFLGVLQLI